MKVEELLFLEGQRGATYSLITDQSAKEHGLHIPPFLRGMEEWMLASITVGNLERQSLQEQLNGMFSYLPISTQAKKMQQLGLIALISLNAGVGSFYSSLHFGEAEEGINQEIGWEEQDTLVSKKGLRVWTYGDVDYDLGLAHNITASVSLSLSNDVKDIESGFITLPTVVGESIFDSFKLPTLVSRLGDEGYLGSLVMALPLGQQPEIPDLDGEPATLEEVFTRVAYDVHVPSIDIQFSSSKPTFGNN